jgi:response regulator RpfG family c-di-GMP phosphodiesterase
MNGRAKSQVLCVDDEAKVVEGIALLLRKEFDVHIAATPEEALRKVRELPKLAVVISDMRMPRMDGATLLHEIKQLKPDATRILLTGEAGRDAAAAAVNKGQIFRFLSKPCPIEELREAIEAGISHHRLMNAERAVLQETLIGCIHALMEVLALANPVVFGRAQRIKRLAMELATLLNCGEFWQLEAAALLSQVGQLALPPLLVEKLHYGAPLTPEEKALADAAPDVAMKLLDHIPRLEPPMQILAALNWNDTQLANLGEGTIGTGARILGAVLEYDTLNAQGKSKDAALQTVRGRTARYGAKIVEQLAACPSLASDGAETLELPLRQVLPGMTILQEIRTQKGVLLVPQGFEVTKSFLERVTHFAPELLAERVRVRVAGGRAALLK